MKTGKELKKAIVSLATATFTGINIYLNMPLFELIEWAEVIAEINNKK